MIRNYLEEQVSIANINSRRQEAQTWKAKWIWESAAGQAQNKWMCFRKTVSLSAIPSSVAAKISVDSKYWMWINGKSAVFEGGLKRGPNRNDTYFDEVDIGQYLKPGENTIAVLVWYWGRHSFNHNSSGQGGFLFEADVSGTKILSDASWAALSHPSYENTGAPHPNWRYSESNIRFNAMADIPGWELPGFDDTAWQTPVELGAPPCAPWNNLWKRPIPQWKDFGLTDYVDALPFPMVSTGEIIKAKLPYNAQVTPYFEIEAQPGQTIAITTDHYEDLVYDTTGDDRRSVRTEYVTRSGIQKFESLAWANGHHVLYSIPAGIKILSLKYRETGYNSEFTGSFSCEDAFISALLEKSRRTLYVCMRDYYMDCPDRERAQWGDFAMQVHQCFYSLDLRSHLLARKAFGETMHWQMADSAIRVPVPNGLPEHNYELPIQGLYVMGRYGLGTYYQHTGDVSLMIEAYPHLRDYLNLWHMRPDGLIVHRKGTWDWSDWGENIDAEILQNIWYYLALETAVLIARIMRNDTDAVKYERRMESIRNNFDRAFWKGTHYSSDSMIDDRANAMAVLAGLADHSKWESISKVLQSAENASPFIEKFVLEALFVMGKPEQAIARMKKRFAEMVNAPSTTLREHWSTVGGTINHGWSGGALILMPEFIAGIAPLTPGFESYQVMPQIAALREVDAKVDTVRGSVAVSIKNSARRFALELTSPTGTNAVVGIPKSENITNIAVNGTTIYADGAFIGRVAGLSFAGENNRYFRFQVSPGTWFFTAGAMDRKENRRQNVSTTSAF